MTTQLFDILISCFDDLSLGWLESELETGVKVA